MENLERHPVPWQWPHDVGHPVRGRGSRNGSGGDRDPPNDEKRAMRLKLRPPVPVKATDKLKLTYLAYFGG